MTDLFVSYKAEDRARIAPLVRALEQDGFAVWWDAHVGTGDQWRESIAEQLDAARLIIVVWSRHSIGPNGQFVRDEATRALRRGAYFPIRIDRVDPPLGFGENQALDLTRWKGDRSDPRYLAMAEGIRGRLDGRGSTRAVADAPTIRTSRRTMIAGGAAAGAAIVGAGGWSLFAHKDSTSDSIAVLPFANLSGDPAQSYFSDGIAEELRSALARIPGLEVVARASSEAMRDEDSKTAASKLGVSNILTGSVRRSPEIVRIDAQLVNGRNGVERWSESYDRAPGDALQIQTDIANNVAQALSFRLGRSDRDRLAEGGTSNPQAFDLLLKARASMKEGDDVDVVDRAISLVDAALALDPRYAEAWAAKADFQAYRSGSYAPSAADAHDGYARAAISARRAIALAPRSRFGYGAFAEILDQQLKRREAYAQYQQMLAFAGTDGNTLASWAIFLVEMRRPEEAIESVNRAVAHDPLNPRSYRAKFYVYANARRFREAGEAATQLMKLVPQRKQAIANHAYCLMLMGDLPGAAVEFDRAEPLNLAILPYRAALAVRQGHTALAERLLGQLQKESGDAGHYQEAQALAQLHRTPVAIEMLKKAFAAVDPGLTQTLVDPLLDPLRDNAQFLAFEKSLDFPAA